MSTGTLMPSPNIQYADANGVPYAGGKLFSYLAGTSTPTPTYTDAGLTVAHTNPIILDAAGRAGATYLDALSYKFVLQDANSVTIWTIDNVQAVQTSLIRLGAIFIFGGNSDSPVTATSYPSGATLDKTHAGTAVYHEDAANIPAGSYVLEGVLQAISGSATISAALVNLTDGSPDTAIVTIASTSTTGARVQSSPITFAVAGAAKDYGVKTKVDTGAALAWGFDLRRIA